MSHFTPVKAVFKDKQALFAALDGLGLRYTEHTEAKRVFSSWAYGIWGEEENDRMAEIHVHRGSIRDAGLLNGAKGRADIGFYRANDGYRMIVDGHEWPPSERCVQRLISAAYVRQQLKLGRFDTPEMRYLVDEKESTDVRTVIKTQKIAARSLA